MIVFKDNVGRFEEEANHGRIAPLIEESFREHHLPAGNFRERNAWANSLQAVGNVLANARIPEDAIIAIEYEIPMTSKRIDCLLSGFDEELKENVVVIELKQWSDSDPTAKSDLVMAFVAGAKRLVAHPSYQALSYAETIANFNADVRKEGLTLHPCAFCHNYPEINRPHIAGPLYGGLIAQAPLFLENDWDALGEFIARYIHKSDQGKGLMTIENGRIKPSRALQDVVGSMLRGNKEFILLDDQKVAYESIRQLINRSLADGKKRVVVVQGGPGTGKSVIAINLLAMLTKEGHNAAYVSKNAAPRNVYFEMMRRGKTNVSYVRNLFKGSGSFVGAKANSFDALLVDEAHRLNEKSGMYQNQGENQIKEIINAARVSVFFLDEGQKITLRDFGSFDEIARQARALGCLLYAGEDYELSSQFRCNGSEAYLAFIDGLLGLGPAPERDFGPLDFDFRVYDDPVALREDLRAKNGNNKARLVAGYCYDWKSRRDPQAMDIILPGGFAAQWNFRSTDTWAIDENSFDQVGCIHTAQGLEFDHIGVIIGKDLRYEKGKVITDPAARSKDDHSLFGLRKIGDKTRADQIIRNTYKVLLTRGQKGAYVYCEDPGLLAYFKEKTAAAMAEYPIK